MRSRVAALAVGLSVVLSALPTQHALGGDNDPCVKNFKVKGGFLTGKTYSTWQEFPQIPRMTAFKRAYAYVIKDGWTITQADKDLGVVSGSKAVGSSSETLNVLIEDLQKGCKVTLTHMIPPGAAAGKAELQGLFCGLLEAVGKEDDKK